MSYLRLQDFWNGDIVVIKTEFIVSISPHKTGCKILTLNNVGTIYVKETLEEVYNMIDDFLMRKEHSYN